MYLALKGCPNSKGPQLEWPKLIKHDAVRGGGPIIVNNVIHKLKLKYISILNIYFNKKEKERCAQFNKKMLLCYKLM